MTQQAAAGGGPPPTAVTARAAEALRQSEAWFRAISEKTTELILVLDAGGRTIYESPSHQTVLGYAPESLLGRSPFDFFHPDERAEAEAQFARMLADAREVISARIRFRHANGSYRTLEIVARNLVAEPAVGGVVINAHDVTEQEAATAARRAAEREARETAERMHTVSRAAADVVDAESVSALQEVAYEACRAVIPFDAFTFGTYEAALHALRFRPNSWSPGDTLELLPVAGRPAEWVVRERQSLLTLSADDPRATGPAPMVDGRRSESVIRTPIVAGDRVLGVISVQSFTPGRYTRRDVELLEAVAALAATALKKIRVIEELRESEERFRSITEAADDAIVSADADGNILTWNPAAERTFGYTAAEIRGRPLTTIMPERSQDSAVRAEDEGSASRTIELDAVRKDGQTVPVELSISTWEQDRVRQYGAIMRDVTERRRVDAALRERKEAAEAASRAKSEFLANMSHEIRTPMNGVLGMLELALETGLTAEQRDYLNVAHRSAESLLGVINDVLDFSKVEAGKLDLEAAPFQLADGLGDTVGVLAPRAQSKGLELALRIAPDVPDALVGDVGRLRQVVVNLVGNAIKFTERGEVVVRVDVAERADREVELHFAVSDTGIGIPREKQAAIFEAFQQADTSTTRVYGGTGLGLTISSRLVELMGGRIWVVSREGQGSTFHFTARFGVRVAGVRAAVASTAPIAPAGPNETVVAARPLRVLLAEDNAVNRKLAVALLARRGHAVVATANGREALAAWEGSARGPDRFDVVLMDVQMPEMDGFAATAAIRAHEAAAGGGARTPIVALTARAMKGDRERCLEAGMDGYVTKPIRVPLLFAAIDEAVGEPRAEAGGAAPAPSPAPRPSEGVFDAASLLAFVDGKTEVLRELATIFLEDAPKYLADVVVAVQRDDAVALQAAAHTLKGAAGTMTARRVADVAQELERIARTADLTAAPSAVATLARELGQLQSVLEEIAGVGSR